MQAGQAHRERLEPKQADGPYTFAQVREAERHALGKRKDEGLIGLAISGGGIRSATFNLGVLQGFAQLGLLRSFDYLSTVSGGGYIGSWLSALIHRRAGGDVAAAEALIAPDPRRKKPVPAATGKEDYDHEDAAVRFLRRYSNYLTPRAGLLSPDTLTAVAIYVRNLQLNLTVLVMAAAALLLACHAIVAASPAGLVERALDRALGAAALGITAIVIGAGLGPPTSETSRKLYEREGWIVVFGGGMVLLGGWLIAHWFLVEGRHLAEKLPLRYWVLACMVLNFLVWVCGWAGTLWRSRPRLPREPWDPQDPARVAGEEGRRWGHILAAGLFAGSAGGVLFYGLAHAFQEVSRELAFDSEAPLPPEAHWLTTALGTVAVVAISAAVVAFQVGLAKRAFTEHDREWIGRLGGFLLLLSGAWLALFLIVIFGPAIMHWSGSPAGSAWLHKTGLGAWLLSTIAGVLLGKSRLTGGETSNRWVEWVVIVSPYVFILGMLIMMAWAVQECLALLARNPEMFLIDSAGIVAWAQHDLYAAKLPLAWLLGLMAAAASAALYLSWRIDINLFAFHQFYRNRLTRCYLGASTYWNPDARLRRIPHAFTDLDPGDDLRLSALAAASGRVQRPLHVINTALNLVASRELAWQHRKAASFCFTPLYSGFELPVPARDGWFGHPVAPEAAQRGAFRPTARYLYRDGGPWLGSAFATSGAAASPNQGYHTSPALSVMLTVFNVRLGQWCANPMEASWQVRSPRIAGRYLLMELLGLTSERSPFVYLSDGGHFENLGIYELVRRRCAVIVACDAGADPSYQFEDLANAIRKCEVDLGVTIDIQVDAIRPPPGEREGKAHHAVGVIRYDLSPEGGEPGTLLYIKSSLTGGEPVDIQHYAQVERTFPQQATSDQWFDEVQFESYRHLGYYIVMGLLERAAAAAAGDLARALRCLP